MKYRITSKKNASQTFTVEYIRETREFDVIGQDDEYIGSRKSLAEANVLGREYETNQAELESRFVTKEAA